MHTHADTHTYTHTHTHTHTYVHTHIIHMHTHIQRHTQIQIHTVAEYSKSTYVHTYTFGLSLALLPPLILSLLKRFFLVFGVSDATAAEGDDTSLVDLLGAMVCCDKCCNCG